MTVVQSALVFYRNREMMATVSHLVVFAPLVPPGVWPRTIALAFGGDTCLRELYRTTHNDSGVIQAKPDAQTSNPFNAERAEHGK